MVTLAHLYTIDHGDSHSTIKLSSLQYNMEVIAYVSLNLKRHVGILYLKWGGLVRVESDIYTVDSTHTQNTGGFYPLLRDRKKAVSSYRSLLMSLRAFKRPKFFCCFLGIHPGFPFI